MISLPLERRWDQEVKAEGGADGGSFGGTRSSGTPRAPNFESFRDHSRVWYGGRWRRWRRFLRGRGRKCRRDTHRQRGSDGTAAYAHRHSPRERRDCRRAYFNTCACRRHFASRVDLSSYGICDRLPNLASKGKSVGKSLEFPGKEELVAAASSQRPGRPSRRARPEGRGKMY